MVDWEQENIFPNEVKAEMESMWEVLSIINADADPGITHF